MVVQGDGEAFLPTVYCREQEERGLLVRVPDSPKQQFDVYLVYPSREYVSRKVRIVMDAVIDYAEKHLNGQAISGKDATTAGCG
jgi:DNA-binding transcriptional LysR family regulator